GACSPGWSVSADRLVSPEPPVASGPLPGCSSSGGRFVTPGPLVTSGCTPVAGSSPGDAAGVGVVPGAVSTGRSGPAVVPAPGVGAVEAAALSAAAIWPPSAGVTDSADTCGARASRRGAGPWVRWPTPLGPAPARE